MNGKQMTVMWLGILLIITRLLTTGQWSAIWGTVSNKSGTSSAGSGSSAGNAQAPGNFGQNRTAPGTQISSNPNLYGMTV